MISIPHVTLGKQSPKNTAKEHRVRFAVQHIDRQNERRGRRITSENIAHRQNMTQVEKAAEVERDNADLFGDE